MNGPVDSSRTPRGPPEKSQLDRSRGGRGGRGRPRGRGRGVAPIPKLALNAGYPANPASSAPASVETQSRPQPTPEGATASGSNNTSVQRGKPRHHSRRPAVSGAAQPVSRTQTGPGTDVETKVTAEQPGSGPTLDTTNSAPSISRRKRPQRVRPPKSSQLAEKHQKDEPDKAAAGIPGESTQVTIAVLSTPGLSVMNNAPLGVPQFVVPTPESGTEVSHNTRTLNMSSDFSTVDKITEGMEVASIMERVEPVDPVLIAPATPRRIDWAVEEADDEDLPDLNDWGVTSILQARTQPAEPITSDSQQHVVQVPSKAPSQPPVLTPSRVITEDSRLIPSEPRSTTPHLGSHSLTSSPAPPSPLPQIHSKAPRAMRRDPPPSNRTHTSNHRRAPSATRPVLSFDAISRISRTLGNTNTSPLPRKLVGTTTE